MCIRSILGLCRIYSVDEQTYFADVQTKCAIFGALWNITVSAHFVHVNTKNIVIVLNHLWSFYVRTTDGRSLLTENLPINRSPPTYVTKSFSGNYE